MTPLHYAMTSKNLKLIQYLIKKGGNLNIKNLNDQTPLDICGNDDKILTAIRYVQKGVH